jgi:hypothetical protein
MYEAGIGHGVQPRMASLQAMPQHAGTHRLLSDDGQRLLGLVEVHGAAMRLAVVFPHPLAASTAGQS